MEKDFVGAIVEVYLSSGHTVEGAIKHWNEPSVVIKKASGNLVYIYDDSNIIAIEFVMAKNGDIVKENKPESIEPQHKPGSTESLIALRQMKARDDKKQIKKSLTSTTPTKEAVEYGNQLSCMRAIKNNLPNKD